MPEGEDKDLLEAILLESSTQQAPDGQALAADHSAAPPEPHSLRTAEHPPVQGVARDFAAADGAAAASSGAARAGQQAAAVGEAVVATFRDLKLGEKLGFLGDKVLTNIHPDRVLQEIVEVPVGILGWQLKLPEGWGPYLCLPVQDGSYTRLQLAASVQSLLQSTVGEQNLEWKVVVMARHRRLCFRLRATGPDARVCGFRLAPSSDLCEPFGATLGADGWITSETEADGSFCAGHAALGGVPVDWIPAMKDETHSGTGQVGGAGAGLKVAAPATAHGGGRAGAEGSGWREALRVSLGRHLEVASAELSDIGMAARQSGASMLKLMKHPIASFGVPLHVVVRREMEVVASCGGLREERPPIVMENLLSALDSQWGASSSGALLLQQQQGLSSSPQLSIYDTLMSGPGTALASEDWQQRKAQMISLLDDSPGAPELAGNRDATLIWEVLRSFLNELPEPLLTFAGYQPIVSGACASAGNEAAGGQATDAAGHRLWEPLQTVAAANAAHMVTARRLLKFLHRHIFVLPIRRSGSGGTTSDNLCRDEVLRRVAMSIGLALLRPSNDANAVAAALPAAYEATQTLIRHVPAVFP